MKIKNINLFFAFGIFLILLLSITPLSIYPYELTSPILISGVLICILSFSYFFIYFFTERRFNYTRIKIPIFLACLLLMLIISAYKGGMDIWNLYIANIILLFLLLNNLLKDNILNSKILNRVLWGVISIEVIKLILKFDIFHSSNILNYSLGFSNNNITAMFFVLILTLISQNEKLKIQGIVLLYLLGGLIVYLLHSRTGLLGIFSALIMNLLIKTNKSTKINNKYILGLIIIILTTLLVGFIDLNNEKSESTEGRMIIWINSLSIIQEQPIFGYGLGSFKKQIGIQFIDYFSRVRDNNEMDNFTHQINIAYNDLIQLTIESGILGFCFYVSLILLVIRDIVKRTINYTTVSLSCFLIMSTTNSIFYAVPCGYLLALCLALNYYKKTTTLIHLNMQVVIIFALLLSFIAFYKTIRYENAIRQTYSISKQNTASLNLEGLRPYQKVLASSDFYWLTVANNFFKVKSYQNSERAAENVIDISYDYRAFDLLADISRIHGSTQEEKYLAYQNNIVPGLLLPKYKLFQYYKSINDKENAKKLALEIVEHKEKGKFDVTKFKLQAKNYLEDEY